MNEKIRAWDKKKIQIQNVHIFIPLHFVHFNIHIVSLLHNHYSIKLVIKTTNI
jgi:hypothetical protein